MFDKKIIERKWDISEEISSEDLRKFLFIWGLQHFNEQSPDDDAFLYAPPESIPPSTIVFYGGNRGQGPGYDEYNFKFERNNVIISGRDRHGEKLDVIKLRTPCPPAALLKLLENFLEF